jgi:hypothetical protein
MLNRGGAETLRENRLTEEKLLPIHDAQLLTYLKLYKRPLGLLMNFDVPALKDGIKRLVNQFQEISASPRLGGE